MRIRGSPTLHGEASKKNAVSSYAHLRQGRSAVVSHFCAVPTSRCTKEQGRSFSPLFIFPLLRDAKQKRAHFLLARELGRSARLSELLIFRKQAGFACTGKHVCAFAVALLSVSLCGDPVE
ncbi:hypothetical protein MRX96_024563 [Rhipicephalus microplus]